MAFLRVIQGESTGKTFNLTDSQVIGRSYDNDIWINDPIASRHHARIFKKDNDFYVEDLGSKNGTLLENARINGTSKLNNNSIVTIGSHFLQFVDQGQRQSDKPDYTVVAESCDFEKSVFISVNDYKQQLDMPTEKSTVNEEQTDQTVKVSKRLGTFYKISDAIGSLVKLDDLLEEIMKQLFEVFPQADKGAILLKNEKTGEMVPHVVKDRKNKEKPEVLISRTIINEVVEKKVSVLTKDALDDERFQNQLSIQEFGIRAMMCSPMIVREETLGLIQIHTKDIVHSFETEDLKLLTGIAIQAAIKVKNANLMSQIESEAELRTNLSRYLSPDIVERAVAGNIEFSLGGSLRDGTICFSDIIGFTEMSDILPPEEVVSILNRHFEEMVSIVFNNGGMVDKFGGDSMLCVWGAWNDEPGQTVRAINASLEMQASLFKLNSTLSENAPHIHMGIGLNSGTFLVGNIGSEAKMEFTVIGDSVNMAQRVESKAMDGMVLVSQHTLDEVSKCAIAFEMDPIELKGKSGKHKLYSIRGIFHENYMQLLLPCEIKANNVTSSGFVTGGELISQNELELKIMSNLTSAEGDFALSLKIPEMPGFRDLHGVLPGKLTNLSNDNKVTFIKARIQNVPEEFMFLTKPCKLPAANPNAYKQSFSG